MNELIWPAIMIDGISQGAGAANVHPAADRQLLHRGLRVHERG